MSDYPPTEWMDQPGFHPVTVKSIKMKYGDEAKPAWADTSINVFVVADDKKAANVSLEISPLKFSNGDRPSWLVDRLNENLEALGIDLKFDRESYDPQDAIVKCNDAVEQALGNKVILKMWMKDNGWLDYKFTKLLEQNETTQTDTPMSTEEVAEAFDAKVF